MKGNSLRTDKERKLERLNRRFNAYLNSKGLNNDTIKLNDIEDFMDENFRTGNKSKYCLATSWYLLSNSVIYLYADDPTPLLLTSVQYCLNEFFL